MFYLIAQIALTLFFTALIGITMGWLLRGLGTSRQTDAIEARWRARVAQLQERGASGTAATAQPPAVNPATEQRVAELQRQVQKRDEALEALRTAKNVRATRKSDTEAQAMQLKETTELCNQLQGHLAQQSNATDQLRAQLKRLGAEKEMLIERLRDRETEIGRMGQERQHAINTIASLQKEMRTIRGQQSRQSAAAKPATAATQPGGPTASRPAATTQPPANQAGAGRSAPGVGSDRKRTPPATSETPAPGTAAPASTPAPAAVEPVKQQTLPMADTNATDSISSYQPTWRLSSPEGPKDNLQAIFGIGPKLEMQLNTLGIFHFEQIGRFERNDILWVAHHLKSFPGRIVRDRWIEQAQTLANRKRN